MDFQRIAYFHVICYGSKYVPFSYRCIFVTAESLFDCMSRYFKKFCRHVLERSGGKQECRLVIVLDFITVKRWVGGEDTALDDVLLVLLSRLPQVLRLSCGLVGRDGFLSRGRQEAAAMIFYR